MWWRGFSPAVIIETVRRLDDALIQRLYKRAAADRWQLSPDAFASFLFASAQRAFSDEEPSSQKLERYFESLHLEDLALACACAEGDERAWDKFITDYRPVLYRAADALSPSGGAREVADSLYGELYGLKTEGDKRRSHLRYFHGRSSLATWLRAVLSQRYVDRQRVEARLVPLPDQEEADAPAHSRKPAQSTAMLRFVEVLQRVIAAVVDALPPRDRLRLRLYYAQDMTLAQIGKALGESEATASRQLNKARGVIREEVVRTLRDEERLTDSEIEEGFAAVVEDSGSLDLAEMLGEGQVGQVGRVGQVEFPRINSSASKKSGADRSK